MARVAFSRANKIYSENHDPRVNKCWDTILKPAEDKEIKFDKNNFPQLVRACRSHFGRGQYTDMLDILDNIEQLPQLAPLETPAELQERKVIFYLRRNLLVQGFSRDHHVQVRHL